MSCQGHGQTALEAYFTALCQFAYDRAKDMIEKERDAVTSNVWTNLVNALVQFAPLEKSYMHLIFLLPKGFLRKDTSLKAAYQSLRADLQKMEEGAPTDESLDKLLVHLAGQLSHFITARMDMIDFYEKLCNVSINKCLNFDELMSIIVDICRINHKNFHHPILSALKTSFSYECETLEQLLGSQLELQRWNFLASLVYINGAHSKLSAWGALVQPRETRRLSFSPRFLKPNQIPALYQWLQKLKNFLISKFSLYFHDVLSKQTTTQEIKSLCSRTSMDHYQRMSAFQRKTDAVSVALVFDASGLEDYRGPGYTHPSVTSTSPQGLDCYPAVACCPPEKPNHHWPNIVSILERQEVISYDRCIYFYDERVHVTYFLTPIEPRMTVVFIYTGKKSEKDSYITSFLSEFTGQLRCHKLFAALKPGVKS